MNPPRPLPRRIGRFAANAPSPKKRWCALRWQCQSSCSQRPEGSKTYGNSQVPPYTPGTRGRVRQRLSEITERNPSRSLVVASTAAGSAQPRRDHAGRHRGGAISGLYRNGLTSAVTSNDVWPPAWPHPRTTPHRKRPVGRCSLYTTAKSVTSLRLLGLELGPNVVRRRSCRSKTGKCIAPLGHSPVVRAFNNVELYGRAGVAQMVRTAGASAQVMAKKVHYVASIAIPTEVRLGASRVPFNATLGEVGQRENTHTQPGQTRNAKALARRRPQVRGSVDETPVTTHGGGRGPRSDRPPGPGHPPLGKLPSAPQTRKAHKPSNRFACGKRRRTLQAEPWRTGFVMVINPRFALAYPHGTFQRFKKGPFMRRSPSAQGRDAEQLPAINP